MVLKIDGNQVGESDKGSSKYPKSRKPVIEFDFGMVAQQPMHNTVPDQENIEPKLEGWVLPTPNDPNSQRDVERGKYLVGCLICDGNLSKEYAPFMILYCIKLMADDNETEAGEKK